MLDQTRNASGRGDLRQEQPRSRRKFVVGILPNLAYLEAADRDLAYSVWISCAEAGDPGILGKHCEASQIYCVVAHSRLPARAKAKIREFTTRSQIRFCFGENWDVVIESVRLELERLSKNRRKIQCF